MRSLTHCGIPWFDPCSVHGFFIRVRTFLSTRPNFYPDSGGCIKCILLKNPKFMQADLTKRSQFLSKHVLTDPWRIFRGLYTLPRLPCFSLPSASPGVNFFLLDYVILRHTFKYSSNPPLDQCLACKSRLCFSQASNTISITIDWCEFQIDSLRPHKKKQHRRSWYFFNSQHHCTKLVLYRLGTNWQNDQ